MAGDRNKVYVAFSGGTGLLCWLIKKFTGSDVNHAFLVYWDQEFGGWLQLGADAGGWMESPAEDRGGCTVVRLYAPPAGVDLKVGLKDLRVVLGAGYDVGGLVGMMWVLLMRKLGRQVQNPLQSNRRFFCSEIVDLVCARSGWELELGPAGAVDPGQEEKAVVAHGGQGPLTLDDVIGEPGAAKAA